MVGENLDLIVTKSGAGLSVNQRDGRRRCADFPHDAFKAVGCFKILRPRQTVRNHRRLERDHRTAIANGTLDFGSDIKNWAPPWSAAAWRRFGL